MDWVAIVLSGIHQWDLECKVLRCAAAQVTDSGLWLHSVPNDSSDNSAITSKSWTLHRQNTLLNSTGIQCVKTEIKRCSFLLLFSFGRRNKAGQQEKLSTADTFLTRIRFSPREPGKMPAVASDWHCECIHLDYWDKRRMLSSCTIKLDGRPWHVGIMQSTQSVMESSNAASFPTQSHIRRRLNNGLPQNTSVTSSSKTLCL